MINISSVIDADLEMLTGMLGKLHPLAEVRWVGD